MFTGDFQYKLDEKGRFPFPPRFKEELGGRFVLSRVRGKRITIYPMPVWKQLADKWDHIDPSEDEALEYQTQLFGTSLEAELDPQGRLTLPPNFRQHAGVGGAVVVVGVNRYLEIWAKEVWDEESRDPAKRMAELKGKMNTGGNAGGGENK